MEFFVRPIIGIIQRIILKYELAGTNEIPVTMSYMKACIHVGPGRLLIYDDWYNNILHAAQFEIYIHKIINNDYAAYTKNYVGLFNSSVYGNILICGNHPKELPLISSGRRRDLLFAMLGTSLLYYFTGHTSILYFLLNRI